MLIYFSATGNTKHLVEEIAYKGEKIIAVDKADNIKEINLEEDQSYYLDDHGNYVVPKYKLDDIVRRI